MPTTLLIVYRVLGTVLFALAAAAIVEKYRTVRGAALLPARVLECRRRWNVRWHAHLCAPF